MEKLFFIFFLYFQFARLPAQMLWQFNKDTIIAWHYETGDEFNEKELNTEKWSYWYGWSRSIFLEGEQEYYTDGKNHEFENGNLKLFAKREPVEARMVDWLPDTDSMQGNGKFYGLNKRTFDYTAGMIQSKRTFKYGYFEIKFKIPKDKGYWPAFWLYGGTPNEEIDWMELKTEKTHAIHVGRHSQKKEENKLQNGLRKKWWGDWVYFKGNLNEGYNVIAGEWNNGYLKYFLNGECIAYTKVSLNEEKVLCANIAVPGKDGSFHPAPDTSITRSGNFAIDYIRVWTNNENNAQPFPLSNLKKDIAGVDTITKSKLTSKTKFLYGTKADHKNEGFTLSLIPCANNVYNLQALGRDIPAMAVFTLKQGTMSISKPLVYGENIFSVESLNNTAELTVECYGKKLSYTIVR